MKSRFCLLVGVSTMLGFVAKFGQAADPKSDMADTEWLGYNGGYRCYPVLAAHADQHEERLEAEAGMAVRRHEHGGWPEPGRPDSCARPALHLHRATDDRRTRSGDRRRDLEA
jgi:hypothetical protein